MRRFQDLPLRRKLTIITTLISGVALLLVCVVFAAVEQRAVGASMRRDFAILADMFDDNVASGLAFDDPRSIEQTLKTLKANPRILAACVYDRGGAVVASYRRDDQVGGLPFPAMRQTSQVLTSKRLDTFKDIALAGENIGAVYIGSDLAELRERQWHFVMVAGLLLVGCSLVALVLAARLQMLIAQPILDLARTAQTVAVDKNYALRAREGGDDEVGQLVRAFNGMLAQIQGASAALIEANDRLEMRVEERTADLRLENAERKRAEAALRESQELYLSLVEHLPIYVYRKDAHGRFIFVNSRFCEFYNRPPEQILGQTVFEVARPEEALVLAREDRGVIESRRTIQVEEQVMQNGRLVFLHSVKTPVFDSAGKIAGTQGMFFDITEIKRAQQETARQKARFQLIFESLPVGICLDDFSPSGERTRLINDAHLRICGLTREQVGPGAFRRLTHPEDQARDDAFRQQLVMGLCDRFAFEKRYVRPGGEVVWVSFSLQRKRYPDGSYQDLTTVVDITQLKHAQEEVTRERARFKFIFDAVPVGISLVVPASGMGNLVNPAHERITGLSARQLHEPDAFQRVTHPEDWERQRPLAEQYAHGVIDRFTVEERYLHGDGVVVWASLTRRMFTDAVSGQKQSVTTLVDITERKAAEAKLAETHRQLLQTSRQAGMAEVATGVLHNVGNVLNSVNVSATLLIDMVRHSKVDRVTKLAGLLEEQKADLAGFFARDPRAEMVPGFVQALSAHLTRERDDMLLEIESLRKYIEHIKDIVAMQQNYAKVSGVCEMVAVSDLVNDALRMNSSTLARRDIEVVREFAQNPTVSVDKHKVLQILVNLIRNAKFACDESDRPDKRILVHVGVADGRVTITVKDNGIGIPPENLTRIFAHGFTTRKQGHGFGLHSGAIAARELGGSLTAQSDGLGCGAIFTLELPLAGEAKAS